MLSKSCLGVHPAVLWNFSEEATKTAGSPAYLYDKRILLVYSFLNK